MPWKESSVVDEHLRFVARLLDGETMTEVCRNFGIQVWEDMRRRSCVTQPQRANPKRCHIFSAAG